MTSTQDSNFRLPQVHIAPAPTRCDQDDESGEGASSETHMPYTCLTCVRRKVRCDKLAPKCSTCQKARLGCEYQAPPPRKRKRKDTDDTHDRLAKYERILRAHGLLEESSDTPSSDTTKVSPRQTREQSPPPKGFTLLGAEDEATLNARLAKLHKDGRLLSYRGKSHYVNNALWRNLADDVLESSDDEDGGDNQFRSGLTRANTDLNALTATMVSSSASHTNLLDAHPSYTTAMFLWKSYVDYVEPLIKVVHVPTSVKVVQRVAANPSTASKPVECFLFAVYHFAVSSLTEEECRLHLGASRSVSLSKYQNAANQAFVNASFLKTTNMMVLQAYLIYLLSIRTTCDPQTYWILTGIAIRIGQRLGVHRDGDELGLSPFETQMRRRFFWQLLPLDGLASQSCGTGISLQADSWTVKQPLNLNDEDIWPEMTEQPVPRTGATDMIFCLCRTEVGRFFQRAYPFLGNWSKVWEARDGSQAEDMLKMVDDLENVLENKYIRYCNIFQPIHGITNAMARVGMNVARFRILFSQIQGKATRDEAHIKKTLSLAIEVLEYGINAVETKNLVRFHWHLKAFFQWDPLAFLLNELLRSPSAVDPDTVWPKIERLYTAYPELGHQRRTLNLAVGRLVIRAWESNPSGMIAPPGSDPAFIIALRESCVRKDDAHPPRLPISSSTASTFDNVDDLTPDVTCSIHYRTVDTPPKTNTPGANFLDGFDGNNMDWEFWDRLIRDPYAFARE